MTSNNSIRIIAVRYAAAIVLLLFAAAGASADRVTIAQIDTSTLLLNQEVDLYLNLTDDQGVSLQDVTADMLEVFESSDGEEFEPVPGIVGLRSEPNLTEGINFLLLIDNSGSMYDTLGGEPTNREEEMRITSAKEALRTFLADIENPRDTVSLVAFNTFYQPLSSEEGSVVEIADYLNNIRRPEDPEAFTELYAGIDLAVDQIAEKRGRKVIIVLTDGENYPYYVYENEPHPVFGEKVWEYTEPIEDALREGVTVYAINFSDIRDRHIRDIAQETGGMVFNARDAEELGSVYETIRERVLNEYLLSYRATMIPADRKFVKVVYDGPGGPAESTRYYFSSLIFGVPATALSPLLLLPLLLALGLLFVLTRLRFERSLSSPGLEVLSAEGAPSTKLFSIQGKRTVIGGGANADLTIAGAPSMRENHATVVFDERKKKYTIIGEGDLYVNNQPVKQKDLAAGDVINVGGTTIVFDDDVDRPPSR